MGRDGEASAGADRGTASAALRPTNLPSGIRLVDVVGRGATSTVWRARDRREGRDVAVKVVPLPPDPAGRELAVARFEHEVRSLARLSDLPQVLALRAAGTDRAGCWLVTPLARGSLADLAPISRDDVLGVATANSAALAGAHDRDVVHGDVSPANVLWVDDGPVVSDFGLAVLQPVPGAGGSARRASLGATPGWAAPERLEGEVPTPASDAYGWGATIWTACTGEPPPVLGVPALDRVPRGLAAIVRSCCDPRPAARPTMAEVVREVAGEVRRRARYCPEP